MARPFKVTDELFDLSTMAMEYFREHLEPNLPDIACFSKDYSEYCMIFPFKMKNLQEKDF